jgi:hypothetical protein
MNNHSQFLSGSAQGSTITKVCHSVIQGIKPEVSDFRVPAATLLKHFCNSGPTRHCLSIIKIASYQPRGGGT